MATPAPLPLLVACLGMLLAVPAAAIPVTHTLTPESSFSADLDFVGMWNAQTSLGTASGELSFSGTLSGTPTGEADIDWGSPGWDGTLAVPSFDIRVSNLGTVNGSTGFNLFGFLPVTLRIGWSVDSLTLSDSSMGASLSAPVANPPGTGPWTVSDTVGTDVSFSSTVTVTVLGLGAPTVSASGPIPFLFPLSVELERTGGFPGTGSMAGLDYAFADPFALTDSNPIPVGDVAGCELPAPFPFPGCVFDVQSLSLTFTKSDLSNFSLRGVATSSVGIVPEPSIALLLGLSLAALACRRGPPEAS